MARTKASLIRKATGGKATRKAHSTNKVVKASVKSRNAHPGVRNRFHERPTPSWQKKINLFVKGHGTSSTIQKKISALAENNKSPPSTTASSEEATTSAS